MITRVDLRQEILLQSGVPHREKGRFLRPKVCMGTKRYLPLYQSEIKNIEILYIPPESEGIEFLFI